MYKSIFGNIIAGFVDDFRRMLLDWLVLIRDFRTDFESVDCLLISQQLKTGMWR
jgi:hypothetical protein